MKKRRVLQGLPPSSAFRQRRSQRLTALLGLWVAVRRRTPIAAIRAGPELVVDADAQRRELGRHWSRTFAREVPLDELALEAFCRQWVPRFPSELAVQETAHTLARYATICQENRIVSPAEFMRLFIIVYFRIAFILIRFL